MKTNTARGGSGSGLQALTYRHPLRRGFRRIVLAGVIAAAIVATAVELIAALVTGAWPTGMADLIAAVLAGAIGCIVAMIVTFGELAHRVDASFVRIAQNVGTIQASTAGAAATVIAAVSRRAATPDSGGSALVSKNSRANGVLSGILEGVEHDVEQTTGYDLRRDLVDMPIRELVSSR